MDEFQRAGSGHIVDYSKVERRRVIRLRKTVQPVYTSRRRRTRDVVILQSENCYSARKSRDKLNMPGGVVKRRGALVFTTRRRGPPTTSPFFYIH